MIDNYVGALTIFGSSIPIMILSMDVTNQTMLLFFGIVTIASGLIMAISIPVVREREEFYQHEEAETFSIKEFFAGNSESIERARLPVLSSSHF